jgi:DNA-binding CsgD family transcriptional regulator/PAS domain-containing protein
MRHTDPAAGHIADIYEAALDDALWPALGGIVARAAAAPTSAIWIVENGLVTDLSVTEDGRDTDVPYREHFWRLDPWQRRVLAMPPDRVRLGYEVFPEAELVKTEFYNDFARRFGLMRPMAATIRLTPGVFATAGLERPGARTLFEEDDKLPLVRLIPHIKRALQLRRRRQAVVPGTQWRTAALDAFAFGIVICDRTGRIEFANTAAEALALSGAGLILGRRGHGIGALVAREAQSLAALIDGAARGTGGGALRLTGKNGRASLLVLVTPLPARLHHAGALGHVMVALRRETDDPSFGASLLIALFGLSPAQAALALALYAGKSFDEIAAERGVQVSTLRTHYEQVLTRTRASGLRDLVRLLGSLPPVR